MPELDAERREALHQRLKESPGCYEGESCCLDSLDSIAPLIAGWLAEAEAGALREAADSIERELVCCDAFETRDPRHRHKICYWGGAAAKLTRSRADRAGED